jgi:hypothetical protein
VSRITKSRSFLAMVSVLFGILAPAVTEAASAQQAMGEATNGVDQSAEQLPARLTQDPRVTVSLNAQGVVIFGYDYGSTNRVLQPLAPAMRVCLRR